MRIDPFAGSFGVDMLEAVDVNKDIRFFCRNHAQNMLVRVQCGRPWLFTYQDGWQPYRELLDEEMARLLEYVDRQYLLKRRSQLQGLILSS